MRDPPVDAPPLAGTMVVHDERIVYASEALAALAGRSAPELLGRPALDLFVPEERPRLEELRARALRGEPVPRALELTFGLPGGDRRPVECLAERDGVDLLVHVRDLGAQTARRRRLDALASIGAAIRTERSEPAVHARVRRELEEIGVVSALMHAGPGGLRIEWFSAPEPLRQAFVLRTGALPEGYVGAATALTAKVRERGAVFTDDWVGEAPAFLPAGLRDEARTVLGGAGLTRGILVRLDASAEELSYLVVAGSWLRSDDVPAVRLFAAQFSAALDAARTISDLSRQNARLAVLNRIAELAGEATDLSAFLQRASDVLRPAAGHAGMAVFVHDPASATLHRVYSENAAGALLERSRRAPAASHLGAVLRDRCARVESLPYPGADPELMELLELGALAYVPLVARSRAIGVLVAGFADAGPARAAVDLLSAVGAHFASAIESHGLLSDLRRRLSDVEAVHALALRVFENAPGDVRALLADGCSRIAQALSARAVAVFLASPDGATLRVEASVGSPHLPPGTELEIARDPFTAEVMRRGSPVVSDDVTRDPRSILNGRRDIPPTATVAVPLAARAAVRGVVLVGDTGGRSFSSADVALASALAGGLGVGVENAELFAETRRRAEELGLLHEVGRSLVQTLDIEQVLAEGIRNLARIVDAPAAFLSLLDADADHLAVRAVSGAPAVAIGERVPLATAGPSLAALVFDRREPVLVQDALSDPRVEADSPARGGARAYLGLPLVVRDRTIGSVVIVETRGPRCFTPAEVERGAAVANQLAVAAENARLYEDLRRSYAQLARAQQRLIEGERLSALGELSAIVAHEVRNPLGVIFNSLGSLRRLVRPAGDAKMLFDIVDEEADRLNRIVGDLLDFARPSPPQLRPEELGRVVEDAVAAAVSQAGGGVALARELDPSLAAVAIDARLVRQAVLNVAVNAIQAMPRGGRITIRTRRQGDSALVEIEDTGAGMPDEVRARIFEPFFTTKASGTGLGLAVVKRIVEGHGGSVSVRGGPDAGTVFALSFPLGGAPVENGPVIG